MHDPARPQDITAIGIHLNELRSTFDHAIREGQSFEQVKQIHAQIKELETQLQALNWAPRSTESRNPDRGRNGFL